MAGEDQGHTYFVSRAFFNVSILCAFMILILVYLPSRSSRRVVFVSVPNHKKLGDATN